MDTDMTAKSIMVLVTFSIAGGMCFGFWQSSFSAASFMAILLFMISASLWEISEALYRIANKER